MQSRFCLSLLLDYWFDCFSCRGLLDGRFLCQSLVVIEEYHACTFLVFVLLCSRFHAEVLGGYEYHLLKAQSLVLQMRIGLEYLLLCHAEVQTDAVQSYATLHGVAIVYLSIDGVQRIIQFLSLRWHGPCYECEQGDDIYVFCFHACLV